MKITANDLIQNKNTEDILGVLNALKQSSKILKVWRVVAGKKVFAEVKVSIVRKTNENFVIKAINEANQKVLNQLNSGVTSMYFYLPENLVLFEAEYLRVNQLKNLEFRFPKMMAHVEKRKHVRLFNEEQAKLEIRFHKESAGQFKKKQFFRKPCFDISGGGLSFIVSKTEMKFFKEEDYITSMELMIEGKVFVVSGQIVSMLELEPNNKNKLIYKGHKVCLSFDSVNIEVEKEINDFVFKHVDIAI